MFNNQHSSNESPELLSLKTPGDFAVSLNGHVTEDAHTRVVPLTSLSRCLQSPTRRHQFVGTLWFVLIAALFWSLSSGGEVPSLRAGLAGGSLVQVVV